MGNALGAASQALPLAGGVMSGPIAMGGNQVTGLGDGYALSAAAAQSEQAYPGTAEYWLNGGVVYRESRFRFGASSDQAGALTPGVMTSAWLLLFAGDVVTNLTFVSGATAANLPLHWWFALYSSAATPALLAQTADQGSAAWAASTPKTLALTAAQTIPTTGIYYASCMVAGTGVPSLCAGTVPAVMSGSLIGSEKILAQTSGAALTTTAPATITGATTIGIIPYVIAS